MRNHFTLWSTHAAILFLFAFQSPQNQPADFAKHDFSTLRVQAKVHTDGDPDWLATGFGSLWVSVPKLNQIVRINPANNKVRARIQAGLEPCYGIGIGVTRLWTLNCKSQTLARIDPGKGKVDLSVPVNVAPHGEGSIAVTRNSVWFVSNEDGHSSTLVQMDTRGKVKSRIKVGAESAVVTAAFGSIWVTSSGEAKIYHINPVSRKVIATIGVAATPRFTAAGEGSLWVLSQSDGSVARIDPIRNKVVATIQAQVPGSGGDIGYGGGIIWVAAAGTPVTRIDPKGNRVIDQYGNYKGADAIRFGFGSAWVSDHAKGDLWRIAVPKM